MSTAVQMILSKYVNELEKIYGTYLKSVILYGSYARGDFSAKGDRDYADCSETASANAELLQEIMEKSSKTDGISNSLPSRSIKVTSTALPRQCVRFPVSGGETYVGSGQASHKRACPEMGRYASQIRKVRFCSFSSSATNASF